MCSDPVHPGKDVQICSAGCVLGMPEISPFVFIVAASRYMRFIELNNAFSIGGVLGAAEFVLFWYIGMCRFDFLTRRCE